MALIGVLGSVAVAFITSRAQVKKSVEDSHAQTAAQIDARMDQFENRLTKFESDTKHSVEKIDLRIDVLTKTVDKHNSVIERTYELEKKAELCEEKIKVANNRILDLERRENDDHK